MSNPHVLIKDEKFVKVLDSLSSLDYRGRFYEINYDANYYELSGLIDQLAVDAGCSTFTAKNISGDVIMGRNYDYSHYRNNKKTNPYEITGVGVVVRGNNPAAKYKSIGVADGFWMDANHGTVYEGCLDNDTTDISALALIPFLCMDGVNEAGLAVSIMWVPTKNRWDPIDYIDPESLDDEAKDKSKDFIYDEPGKEPKEYDAEARTGAYCINTADKRAWKVYKNFATNQSEEGKQTVFHPVLMRLILDNCSCTAEAIGLAKTVNVKSAMADSDFHIMVADKSGSSVVLEWVENELRVVETSHATNFFVSREDKYGAGDERDDILAAAQKKYKEFGFSDLMAKTTLMLASQNPLDGTSKGFTQWSSLYNLDKGSLKLWFFHDYDKTFDFTIR